MDNRSKNYIKITRNTSSDQIFVVLDAIQSDDEKDNDQLMNDSHTKFLLTTSDTLMQVKISVSGSRMKVKPLIQ